jgi:hypothetical protein
VLVVCVGLSALAQERPNFSGEWTLNRQASTLSSGADAAQSGLWQIEHREPTFRHKASFVMGNTPVEWEYELLSDGREVISTARGATTASSLRWEESALIVTFRTQHSGGEMKISFRYELVDSGRGLRATEQVRGTDHDQDNVWIFQRQ